MYPAKPYANLASPGCVDQASRSTPELERRRLDRGAWIIADSERGCGPTLPKPRPTLQLKIRNYVAFAIGR
jgi:hypothetical protein